MAWPAEQEGADSMKEQQNGKGEMGGKTPLSPTPLHPIPEGLTPSLSQPLLSSSTQAPSPFNHI